MSKVRADGSPETYYQNDTGPVLEFLYLNQQGNPRDLTGHAGWVSFWSESSAPHVTRAAAVDGANGIHRYGPEGDEFTPTGELLMQSTDLAVDVAAGVDRAFFRVSHPIVRRLIAVKP